MKRKASALVVLLGLLLPLSALAQFSARTRMALQGVLSSTSFRAPARAQQSMPCFVEVSDEAVLARLQAMGVTVNARFGTLVTAQIPLDVMPQLASVPGLRHVAVAQPMTLANDSARIFGNVDAVHRAENLPQAYKGRGVVLGIIDSGVDFNHVAFLDAQGRSRISRVYMPQDSAGTPPVVDGDTLPGSHYATPAQIAALTTDTPTMWHGSHTLGTAAGGYMPNGYHGVAPEADLVVCAMPLLYDTDIACAIRYIMAYADSVHRPAVVSMSFASQEGAHNGTSPLCRLFDELSGPGRIFVIAAGNAARQRIYLAHRFTSPATDTLRTYFDNYNSSSKYSGYVSAWSATEARHRVALTVVDYAARRQLTVTPMFEPTDSVLEFSLDSIPELAPYFTGSMLYAMALEDNGQYHSIIEVDATPKAANYRLGLQVVADEPVMVRAWSSGIIMVNDAGVPGYTAAVRSSCINDLATGDQAISVGAYCSRLTVPTLDGGTRTINRSTPNDIAYFSSYGPDARGIARPEICAPGMALVSAGSRYYDDWSSASLIEEVNGEQYPYFAMSGTSMATPFTAGAVALWLQANPQLSPADVRRVMQATAVRDSYVEAAPARWGFGKLDVAAAMRLVAGSGSPHDVNGDGVVDVEDLNLLINIVLRKVEPIAAADINGDGVVDIEDVNHIINAILGDEN